jgi:hypothetical protein
MTNPESNNAAKAEAVESLVKGAAASSGDANRWAEIAVDSQASKSSDATSKSSDATSRTSDGQSGGGKSEQAIEIGSKIGQAASDIAVRAMDNHGKSFDGTSIHREPDIKHFPEKITDENRKQAKEKLEKELSELIPDKDRQSLKNLQSAIIDGDLGKLQSTLKELSGNPEQLKKIISALNKQMEKTMGVNMRMDSAGNVLLYENGGSTALSINPKTGESTLRPMETQMDGSVVLKPGEIINKTAADVLKNIGDEGTRSLTHGRFYGYIKPMMLEPIMTKPSYGLEQSTGPSWGSTKPAEPWESTKPYLDQKLQNGAKPLSSDNYLKQSHAYPRIPQELNQLRTK